MKNPDILILDEATSALDAESETLVNQALNTLLRENNTTISIAHRLSTIKRSDHIVVIGLDGQVAEQGSFTELSNKKDGAFSQLMKWQMTSEGTESVRADPRPTEEEEIEYDLEKGDEHAEEESAESTGARREK
jgi:putative ABC transport system ATP-binding protein